MTKANPAIITVECWEPLDCWKRWGTGHENTEKYYHESHTEEAVKVMAEHGINLAVTHFFKGFGFQAEKAEMENAGRFIALCHKYDISAGVYFQFDSLFNETFFQEKPEARDWVKRHKDGSPVQYGEGWSFQYYRYSPCPSHRGFIDYLKMMMAHALKEAKVDVIWIDNYRGGWRECYCPECERLFKEFLKKKYNDDPVKIRDRFGFSNFNGIQIPFGTEELPLKHMKRMSDPLIREWIDFRVTSSENIMKEFREWTKEINPESEIFYNAGHIGELHNIIFEDGFDITRLGRWVDGFYVEDGLDPRITKDGILINRIRTYKLGRRLKNKVIAPHPGIQNAGSNLLSVPENDENIKLYIVEHMAFGASMIGNIGSCQALFGADKEKTLALWAGKKTYIDFVKKYEEYYRDTETKSEVAILMSRTNLKYNWDEHNQSLTLFQQTLIQSQTLFDIVLEDDLSDLSRYKALLLPNVACLSAEQAKHIEKYVRNGGYLVITENTSRYDENVQKRHIPELARIFNLEFIKKAKVKHGQGLVKYIPEIKPEKPYKFGNDMVSSASADQYCHLPLNWKELVGEIHNEIDLSVRIKAPLTVAAEFYKRTDKNGFVLHLVNYDTKKNARNIKIALKKSLVGNIKEALHLSPDNAQATSVKCKALKNKIEFSLPELKRYSVIVVK